LYDYSFIIPNYEIKRRKLRSGGDRLHILSYVFPRGVSYWSLSERKSMYKDLPFEVDNESFDEYTRRKSFYIHSDIRCVVASKSMSNESKKYSYQLRDILWSLSLETRLYELWSIEDLGKKYEYIRKKWYPVGTQYQQARTNIDGFKMTIGFMFREIHWEYDNNTKDSYDNSYLEETSIDSQFKVVTQENFGVKYRSIYRIERDRKLLVSEQTLTSSQSDV